MKLTQSVCSRLLLRTPAVVLQGLVSRAVRNEVRGHYFPISLMRKWNSQKDKGSREDTSRSSNESFIEM